MSLFTKIKIFKYKALDQHQNIVEQTIKHNSLTEAISMLEEKNLMLISIKRCYWQKSSKKISLKQLALISHNLYHLIKSGLTIEKSLTLLKEQFKTKHQSLINHCLNRIKQGNSLSLALKQLDQQIPNYFISFIKAGELHGQLAQSLKQANQIIEQSLFLKKTLIKALTYPIIIMSVSLLVIIGMIFFIVPQFEHMYQQMHSPLPAATQILLSTFRMLSYLIPLMILFIFALSSSLKFIMSKSNMAKYKCQLLFLKTPVIHYFLSTKIYIQWLTMLSSFLKSGINIKQALKTSQSSISIYLYRHIMDKVIQDVENGKLLSQSLLDNQWMSQTQISFIAMGESNGELGSAMLQQATLLQTQLTQKIEMIARLLEPLILVILALIIGSMLIVLYLPLFHLGQLF